MNEIKPLQSKIDKQPSNIEAEQALLGSVLVNNYYKFISLRTQNWIPILVTNTVHNFGQAIFGAETEANFGNK